MNEHQPVSLRMKRYRLSHPGCIVFYRQVAEGNAVSLHLHGICTESAHLVDIGVVVVRYNRILYTFADDINIL